MTKKQARIKDIASKAGVSTGTVDRVLHNRGEVSAATREKVLRIIAEMEYRPNLLASTLASRKKIRFNVLLPTGGKKNPYWDAPLRGVHKAAQELDPYGVYTQTYCFSNSEEFRQVADQVMNNQPDALLMAPVLYQESKRFLKQLEAYKIPVVFIDSFHEYPYVIQKIGQNACQSGMVAARLLSFGQSEHPIFAICTIIEERDQLHHFKERLKGFTGFFNNRGQQASFHAFDIDQTEEQLNQALDRITGIKNLNGIFVTGSKVYQIAEKLTILKKEHIPLLGYDLVEKNLDFLEKGTIDFLISQKPEEQAYLGIQALYNGHIQKHPLDPVRYTSIDIITKENLAHYLNCS